MIRWSLFLALTAGAVAYSFWLYLRVELPVKWGRRLALARAARSSCCSCSFSMCAFRPWGRTVGVNVGLCWTHRSAWELRRRGSSSAWDGAASRARALEREGWTVVSFGGGTQLGEPEGESTPTELSTLLAPALNRAVEAGVGAVRVLSDLRFEDAVAVRSALGTLPLDVEFERFGDAVTNAGISGLEVPDLARADGSVTAEVEIHGGSSADSISIEVFEEDRMVAQLRVAPPSSGLRTRVLIDLPTPEVAGRLRYTARVVLDGDAFSSDDEAVTYASVGTEERALVVVSVRPDWEPRHLLPVLEEVTGLPGLGYIRVGPDRYVPMGRALDRGGPVDSATVRRSAEDAALLVLHGLGATGEDWVRSLVDRPGPDIVLLDDPVGAALLDIPTGDLRDGEWYVSSDIPTSPIAGSLVGTAFQGLPPLTSVLLPTDPARVRGSLFIQLRGAGPLEAAVHLEEGPSGRTAVLLASGLWRWAARDSGTDAYRHLWSGIAGWLLAGESVPGAQPRPTQWVVERGEPVTWSSPVDGVERRIVVSRADTVFADVTAQDRGAFETGVLPPGQYDYHVEGSAGDTLAGGRFDVAEATSEMTAAPAVPEGQGEGPGESSREEEPGSPLRTQPWPFLVMIVLLCGEWIGRRRSGLR